MANHINNLFGLIICVSCKKVPKRIRKNSFFVFSCTDVYTGLDEYSIIVCNKCRTKIDSLVSKKQRERIESVIKGKNNNG